MTILLPTPVQLMHALLLNKKWFFDSIEFNRPIPSIIWILVFTGLDKNGSSKA
jgi:hypothetical protein